MNLSMSELLNLQSFKNTASDLISRDVVDNLLLAYLAPMSTSEFPALEIGVFEGESAGYLAEALQLQKRDLVLIDNLGFLSDPSEQKNFISQVLMSRFQNLNINLSRVHFICADSRTYQWQKERFSFFHIDATSPKEDIETCLGISNGKAIFAIDDFLVVPHHLEVVIKMILDKKLFPFAMGNKKMFLSDSIELANQLAANSEIWNTLGAILRVEPFVFFDHPIVKVYTQSSKFYHARMAQYQF